ncbi:MAG: aldehyde dehydrogenase family protein [Acidimicrobiia bacterium]|nr:aldehyde dehydrogenase family protein [Acidimicrobiia bacterium]MCY4432351.1 aldehyde dehydrogenase family protein [bacterium]
MTADAAIRDRYPLLVGDSEVTASAKMAAKAPGTGETMAEVPLSDAEVVDQAVGVAADAQPAWSARSAAERGRYMRDLADAVRGQTERLARIDAMDSGNPLAAMRNDVVYGADALDYFAGIARELHGKTLPASANGLHLTLREPYGVVARILPFNHPLMFTLFHAAAPLAAGNTVIVKAPDQTPISPLEVAYLAAEILPPGVLTVLTGDGPTTGEALVAHPGVGRIGFTGRGTTGLRVMEAAAASGHVKNVTVELGGKNPLLVAPDADPSYVAEQAVGGMNFESSQGQSCGSTSRLYVPAEMHDDVVDAVAARLDQIRVGDPLDEATTMGPLVSDPQLSRVRGYVEAGKSEGARLVRGGGPPDGVPDGGYYLAPTLFDRVAPGHVIATEEIFGPVLSVLEWSDREDLIAQANATRYGLTANIITNDLDWALDTARRVQAGCVWINGRGQHFLETPFGGYKDSGLGAEGSMESLLSYTRTKVVHVLDIGARP